MLGSLHRAMGVRPLMGQSVCSVEPTLPRYRTIVADPPWPYPEGFARLVPTGKSVNLKRDGDRASVGSFRTRELPYEPTPIETIRALPVAALAEVDARLFLWTTNKWLPESFSLLAQWGFEYRQLLVWQKADGGPFITSVAPNTAEFLVVATKGSPERIGSFPSQVLRFPAKRNHSTKPEGILDLIEQVSPGPYAELFSRRARFGWDYPIGDQALGGRAA